MNVDDKSKKFNLYYIISESIEKEKMPFKIYCDMLLCLMKRIEKNQLGEITKNNEQK